MADIDKSLPNVARPEDEITEDIEEYNPPESNTP